PTISKRASSSDVCSSDLAAYPSSNVQVIISARSRGRCQGRRPRHRPRERADMITCTFEDGHAARLRHVVVHAIVERAGALLLVRRAPYLSEGGRWGLPGGFLDRDERLVDGVLRELREETGWTGEVRRLFRINSR